MTIPSRFLQRAMHLPPAETFSVKVHRDVRVPMPDGVDLLADHYVPPPPRRPLILVRCPYGRRGAFGLMFGRLFAERGFQVLVQSCRGTFGSGGTFAPFGPSERTDGLATVEWMRQQPWYPGAFATLGPSYLGMTQWAIAGETGPDHRAIAAQVTASELGTTMYAGGSFSLETMLGWITQVSMQERRLAMLRVRRATQRLQPLFGRLPLGDLDRMATGGRVAYWQEWLAHADPGDPYWTERRFCDDVGRVATPVNLVGGWYDFLLPAMLRDYVALRAAGHDPHLTIGPWRHADGPLLGTAVTQSLGWFRAHLLDDASQLRPQPVRVFVTGAEEWRELDAWPPPATDQRWHLHAGRRLGPQAPDAGEPDRLTYDPADPTPSVGGAGLEGTARVDNGALEGRADVLTYTSAPLVDDLELLGTARADLCLRCDRRHADVFVRLSDVEPAGRSLNVCDGLIRLTLDQADPGADGVRSVRFDLWPAAHRFRRGHRVRLLVAGGAHPRFARNLGTGEPLATATAMATARYEIHRGPDRASAVVLPVAR